jgi:protein involved in polysaccharide export with SLBB domain
MMRLWNSGKNGVVAVAGALALSLAMGCETPGGSVGQGNTSAAPERSAANLRQQGERDPFRVGDMLRVEFLGTPQKIEPADEQIKEDGTISLFWIGAVPAAGKTARELEAAIQEKYVPKYFVRLKVQVNAANRYYYVGGEVKSPNRQLYLGGGVTVLKAIQSAGDFTDFADKKNVRIIRADGRIDMVNCVKARSHPELDLPVYPGDTIHVDRRFL